jgi:DNA-binding response OmpR family regulator
VTAVTGERILIVEDDARIGTSLERALSGSGYDTCWVTTGGAAIEAATKLPPQLVLLDLGLPDIDGLDVCRSLHRAQPGLDVIMLTARDDELDIVDGLDAGAVDYITKPFRLSELLARIRAQLRRSEPRSTTTIAAGGLTVDPASRRVYLGGIEIEFRPKEFDLLARLVVDAGRVLTRDTLMSDIWDEHWFGSTKTLDFHIAAIRQKLDSPESASRITTVRGIGFRYETLE